MEVIQKHYKMVAQNFKETSRSSIEDQFIRDSENDFFLTEILNYISNTDSLPLIFEFGCGNGFLCSELESIFPEARISGLEYSKDLFEICQKRKLSNTQFIHTDIRDYKSSVLVDIAITQRVIINLLSWRWQKQALQNIYDSLNVGGLYLLSESFKSSLIDLNDARRENNLRELSQSNHNRYLQKGFFDTMAEIGFEKIESEIPSNYLSTHFFSTRVIHELMRQPGTKIKNSKVIQFLDQTLPTAVGNYSPIQFHIFRKL